MARPRGRAVSWIAGLAGALALGAPAARAQVGAAVGVDTDDRLRGISVSDERPTLSLNLGYDHASGLYLGGSAALAAAAPGRAQVVRHAEYLGWAVRRQGGWVIDLGLNHQTIAPPHRPGPPLTYAEAYAGVTRNNLSFHLYYSPNYLRAGEHTLYADLSGAVRPSDKWRLSAHVGMFAPVAGPGQSRPRYDLRAAVTRSFPHSEAHLAWTSAFPSFAPTAGQKGSALMAGLAWFF